MARKTAACGNAALAKRFSSSEFATMVSIPLGERGKVRPLVTRAAGFPWVPTKCHALAMHVTCVILSVSRVLTLSIIVTYWLSVGISCLELLLLS